MSVIKQTSLRTSRQLAFTSALLLASSAGASSLSTTTSGTVLNSTFFAHDFIIATDSTTIAANSENHHAAHAIGNPTANADNTLQATTSYATRINRQRNSHIDLWALLTIAAVVGLLSELVNRKRSNRESNNN
ncbi:hypothetical protein N9235_04015 [Gammaproteobacteria bacterium]|nr:hypothetical protein [Gammaproteobacteria bacterium]